MRADSEVVVSTMGGVLSANDQSVKPSGSMLSVSDNCSPFIEHKINLDRSLGDSPSIFRERILISILTDQDGPINPSALPVRVAVIPVQREIDAAASLGLTDVLQPEIGTDVFRFAAALIFSGAKVVKERCVPFNDSFGCRPFGVFGEEFNHSPCLPAVDVVAIGGREMAAGGFNSGSLLYIHGAFPLSKCLESTEKGRLLENNRLSPELKLGQLFGKRASLEPVSNLHRELIGLRIIPGAPIKRAESIFLIERNDSPAS